ncbi:flavin reductase family protein [Methylovirgula sp. 4M-Z18]|uniref:flavin reductase family protein n=1 Tax=Methylovirgula sp. 4M-Z18 TaxID=2293567 RepID=UPI000E2E4416|nr:flavin reductase family protein [Methylovirgula sp. 4M-Z18]RFB81156.1 flavin reductase family protein [Methylovirgula sp. 4M-Z18]
MFYEPEARDKSLLPHDPFKAMITPRPVGWVSSRSLKGDVNLAPYSFFNAFASRPGILGFSSEGRKDSLAFIAESGEFVWNMATFALRDAMNRTSAPLPRGENEFAHAGLVMAESEIVNVPRVAASPCALECKLLQIIDLKDLRGASVGAYLVLGQVVGVHIDDAYLKDGRFDTAAAQPIARCGYADYAVVDTVFELSRPTKA